MKLYNLEIDDLDVGAIDVGSSPDVSEQNVLNERGSATTISGPVPTIGFTINSPGPYGRLRAVEAEAVLSEPAFSPIPISLPAQPDLSGYYAASSVDRDVQLSQDDDKDDYHAVPLTLTRVGTRSSQWRALETNPHEDIDHEFGNNTDLQIAVPAAARKVRWYDPDPGANDLEVASAIETRPTAYGDVDIYDLEDADTDEPVLLYEIDYADDATTDCCLFDTRDADAEERWQSVFSTHHGIEGELILDNGLLRLWLDEAARTLEAQEWDSTTDSWTDVGLEQPASIELFDIDLTLIGMVRDEAQLTFDVDGDLFALDAIVTRGAEDVLFTIPDGETGPVPTSLEEWLTPIASEAVVDPNASKTLVLRSDVRR